MPRGNTKNLKRLTSKEARENGRKGGLASAKKRAWQKEQRELIRAMLGMELPEDNRVRKKLEKMGKRTTFSDGLTLSMMLQALGGDVRAYDTLMRYAGASNKTEAEEKLIEAQAKVAETQIASEGAAVNDGLIDALKGTTGTDWEDGDDK